jgi:hypothetical protein
MLSNNFKKILVGVVVVTTFGATALALNGTLNAKKTGGDNSMSSSISAETTANNTAQDISSSDISSTVSVASAISPSEAPSSEASQSDINTLDSNGIGAVGNITTATPSTTNVPAPSIPNGDPNPTTEAGD